MITLEPIFDQPRLADAFNGIEKAAAHPCLKKRLRTQKKLTTITQSQWRSNYSTNVLISRSAPIVPS
jgi:hypothetical protein